MVACAFSLKYHSDGGTSYSAVAEAPGFRTHGSPSSATIRSRNWYGGPGRRAKTLSLSNGKYRSPKASDGLPFEGLVVRFGVGIFLGGVVPTANAMIGRLTPAADRGRIFGIASSAMFFGQFLGPIAGGAISAAFGIPAMFIVAGLGLLINAAWVYRRVDEVQPALAPVT